MAPEGTLVTYSVMANGPLLGNESEFIDAIIHVPRRQRVRIDMARVGFMKPYDIMLLFLATQTISERTGHRVELYNLPIQAHQYLDRLGFFNSGSDWVYTEEELRDHWSCNRDSTNIMGLERIRSAADVRSKAVNKVRGIVDTWLGKSSQADSVVRIVAELCGNTHEHSGREGYVMVQRYVYTSLGYVEVHVAVGDTGKGIRGSLRRRCKGLEFDSEYILKALNGLSSKGEGKGGDGLPSVEGAIRTAGSSLLIRSGSGYVRRAAGGESEVNDDLSSFPGTRALVVLRA